MNITQVCEVVKVHYLNSLDKILVLEEYCGLIEIPVQAKFVLSKRIVVIKNDVP